MTLAECAVLLDENIHPEAVAYLGRRGIDVLTVVDAGLQGAQDIDVLRYAFEMNRVVFTHDSDFGYLAIARANRPLESSICALARSSH